MALFGGSRDISLFRTVNRELIGNIISQEVVFYKCNLTETKINMYGETTTGRSFFEPMLLNALIEVGDQTAPIQDDMVGFNWPLTFKFLRDDLVDANLHPEVGDIIQYQNGYWEVDNTNATQFFMGKDPQYPYYDDAGNNPLNSGLENFGYNVEVRCDCHYVPSDRLNIIKSRM